MIPGTKISDGGTRLEGFLENAKVYAWETDAQGRYTYLNRTVENLRGFAPGELLGKTVMETLHPLEVGRAEMGFQDIIRKRQAHFDMTGRHLCKDGAFKWFQTTGTLSYDSQGIFLGAKGIANDIDAQKMEEQKRRETETQYRYLFDNTQVGLFVTSAEGVTLNVNKAGAAFLGKKPEEVIGKHIAENYDGPEGAEKEASFIKAFETIRDTDEIMCYLGGDTGTMPGPGGERHIKFFPHVVKVFQDGKLHGVLTTAMDVTDMVAAERKILEYQEHLEQLVEKRTDEVQALQKALIRRERLAALGKLTATISHEMRNPLGTISNSMHVITERLKGKETGTAKAVARAERAIRRCDAIIEALMDFVWQGQLDTAPMDFSRWLNALLDSFAADHDIPIDRDVQAGLQMSFDPKRLERCIRNVLKNAAQAAGDAVSGRIGVTCAQKASEQVLVVVSDNGPGISPEDMEKIFEPLFSTRMFGTGLGLPISKQIVLQHGGTFDVDSRVGLGTTVRIYLPMKGSKAPSEQET